MATRILKKLTLWRCRDVDEEHFRLVSFVSIRIPTEYWPSYSLEYKTVVEEKTCN